jgi:multicomponent Na+:H+ antiporter subunit G
MEIARNALIAALLVVGVFFMLVAALGLWRMPDVYTRMHVNTKSATLGISGILLALFVADGSYQTGARVLLIIAFFFLTAPVGAHMIARATYLARAPRWRETVRDDLKGRYDQRSGTLNAPEGEGEARG